MKKLNNLPKEKKTEVYVVIQQLGLDIDTLTKEKKKTTKFD